MKLYYFNIYGKAESIRVLLHCAKANYQDIRYEFSEWPKHKTNTERFEYGQMPALEKDGKIYTQSTAILKMLGKEYSFYPTDTHEQYVVDNCLESINDFSNALFKVRQMGDEQKREGLENFIKNTATPSFRVWQKRIQSNVTKDFFVGKKLSIADISLVTLYASKLIRPPYNDRFSTTLECYPDLTEYFGKRYEELKEYFDKRPDCSI